MTTNPIEQTAAKPAELFTPDERWTFYMEMCQRDADHFMAYVKNSHPEVFDQAAAYVGRQRTQAAAEAAATETGGVS